MSFIIVWGTLHKKIQRGMVLDVCPACRRIASAVVVDHFTQPHLYGVGYGTGTYITTTRQCRRCHESFAFVETAYDDVMALSVGSAPDGFDRLLRGTNKKLAAIIDAGNKLRALTEESPYRGSAGENTELLKEATAILEKLLLAGYDVKPMFDRVGEWDGATDDERREMVEKLRALAQADVAATTGR